MNDIGAQMADYFTSAPWQTRDNLRVDDRLMALAGRRAAHMAETGEFQHYQYVSFNSSGMLLWANGLVADAGYRLPEWWNLSANYVESIARGYVDRDGNPAPVDALDALAASASHHDHMAGVGFWSDHLCLGCGFARHEVRRMYVVITAPLEPEIVRHHVYLPRIGA